MKKYEELFSSINPTTFDFFTLQLEDKDQAGHGSGWSLLKRFIYQLCHGP